MGRASGREGGASLYSRKMSTHCCREGTPSQAPRATPVQLGAWFVHVSSPALGRAASLQGKTIADAIGVRGKENGPKEKGKEKGQGRGRPAARGEAQRRGAPHTRGGKETGPENSAETAEKTKNRTKKRRSTKTTPNQGGRPTAQGGHEKTHHPRGGKNKGKKGGTHPPKGGKPQGQPTTSTPGTYRPMALNIISALPICRIVLSSCHKRPVGGGGGTPSSFLCVSVYADPHSRTKAAASSDALPPASKARGIREAPAAAYRLRLAATPSLAASPFLRARRRRNAASEDHIDIKGRPHTHTCHLWGAWPPTLKRRPK